MNLPRGLNKSGYAARAVAVSRIPLDTSEMSALTSRRSKATIAWRPRRACLRLLATKISCQDDLPACDTIASNTPATSRTLELADIRVRRLGRRACTSNRRNTLAGITETSALVSIFIVTGALLTSTDTDQGSRPASTLPRNMPGACPSGGTVCTASHDHCFFWHTAAKYPCFLQILHSADRAGHTARSWSSFPQN